MIYKIPFGLLMHIALGFCLNDRFIAAGLECHLSLLHTDLANIWQNTIDTCQTYHELKMYYK